MLSDKGKDGKDKKGDKDKDKKAESKLPLSHVITYLV